MMRRRCGCGQATTADLPAGVRGGPTCYGPNVTAAATLLASQDVLGHRTHRGPDVRAARGGGVHRVHLLLPDPPGRRADHGRVRTGAQDGAGRPGRVGHRRNPRPADHRHYRQNRCRQDRLPLAAGRHCHNPHVYTVRTMRAYTGGGADLVWYGAAGDRTKTSISGFGILDDFRGVLVRDDFGGYISYDADLAGVQQCLAHVLRYLDDAHAIDTDAQAWARQVADALRGAIHEVNTARAADRTDLDAELLTRLRRRYDHGRGGRDLHEPVPALAQGQPPRPATGQTPQTQSPPGVAVHHPTRRSSHEQRLGIGDPRVQTRRQGPRLLAHPGHPATTLPDPFLPDQRPQPRTPTHRRHPRRPHRQPLDATPDSMIHRRQPPDCLLPAPHLAPELGSV